MLGIGIFLCVLVLLVLGLLACIAWDACDYDGRIIRLEAALKAQAGEIAELRGRLDGLSADPYQKDISMRTMIFGLVALLAIPASSHACPPVNPAVVPNGGGGSFSSFGGPMYGAGVGAGGCGAPAVAGNFGGYGGAPMIAGNFGGGGYGGAAMFAAPSYQVQTFAAPAYSASFGVGVPTYSAGFGSPVVVGGYGGRRFGGGFGNRFGGGVYGVGVVAPAVVVPVRAVGPIRGAVQGFKAGLRNRLNGF